VTLYARGYRPYEGPRDATRFPFLPIQREGAHLAMKGRAFRAFFLLSAAMLVLFTVLLYLGEGFAAERARQRGPLGLGVDREGLAAWALETSIVRLQGATAALGQILVLFVGAGLVADDLKSRALPLYLVRPVRPFDYWLGKLLVPVRVLALTVLAPGLLLILVGALFQPSERMLPFLWGRRELVAAVLLHFAFVAVVWSSVALLVSTVAQARVAAIVLGAVVFFAGAIVGGVAQHTEGTLRDALEATSLYGDAQAVLSGAIVAPEDMPDELPPRNLALVMGAAVTGLATLVVLRRARTVEVVS
jgi:ABC-type transport system involved in multi-copper enzyme maturation permease subunit